MEEDLEEEQMNSEAAVEKARKALEQVEQMSSEVAQSQSNISKLEKTKGQLEKQVSGSICLISESYFVGIVLGGICPPLKYLDCPLNGCMQIKDLRERLEEAESLGVRKMKAQLSAMESRVSSLEEQLDVATRYAITPPLCSQLIALLSLFTGNVPRLIAPSDATRRRLRSC